MLSFIKKIISRKKPVADPLIISGADHRLSPNMISKNCRTVLHTLYQAGFEAYIVGGGVRDLLLGHEPKDFDVATNAKPEQIARLFHNCRLIGRRFRLAHIYFKRDIIEVATFRKQGKGKYNKATSADGFLKRDNTYGTLDDDVWRRDFSINALYYDIHNNTIIDYTDGLIDLQQGKIRIIGQGEERYREDPVRILRAIRFAAKLGMTLERDTADAIAKTHPLLASISSARLLDETSKLFYHGNALNTFAALRHYNVLQYLYPLTENVLQDATYHLSADKFIMRSLQNTDARIAENKPINSAFMVAVFLWYPLQIAFTENGTPPHGKSNPFEQIASDILRQAKRQLAFTQVMSQTVMDIWLLQARLVKRHPQKIEYVETHPRFRAAYDFLCLRAEVDETLQEAADWWTHWQQYSATEKEAALQALPKPKSHHRRTHRSKSYHTKKKTHHE